MVVCLDSREETGVRDPEPVECSMSHASMRSLLCKLRSTGDRNSAIIAAMKAGIPLHQIEEELDWADAKRKFQGLAMVAPGRVSRHRVKVG
jgi:hypothetical protein